ncbi:hypothetical protein U719_07250 [Exiguobacterium sp. MH3]|nr:hypothetical protein U719_07250 [Exiguobacterium sp. MH3]
MRSFLRILAMILLVLPVQHLVRGLLSNTSDNRNTLEIFGLNNTMVVLVSIIMIGISIYLFYKTKPEK